METKEAEHAKFGGNGRECVLRLALGLAHEDDCQADASAAQAPAQRQAERHALARQAPAFLHALSAKHRPVIAFANRPKLPRALRQKCLEKLVGQNLVLEALRTERLGDPAAVAADEGCRRAALARAEAQEADLCSRSGTAQVYQNLAARAQALDWPPSEAGAQAEQAYCQVLRAEGASDGCAERQPRALGGRATERRASAPAAASRLGGGMRPTEGAATAVGTARSRPASLQDDELDWESAAPDVDGSEASFRRKVRRHAADELAALPAAAALTPEQRVRVADACADKVVRRHGVGGEGEAEFEARGAAALGRLVAEYVGRAARAAR